MEVWYEQNMPRKSNFPSREDSLKKCNVAMENMTVSAVHIRPQRKQLKLESKAKLSGKLATRCFAVQIEIFGLFKKLSQQKVIYLVRLIT